MASESIHHPDELFQYLEQAHRVVFHYGAIPWEFRFGARSWLLALGISAPLGAARLLGLDEPEFYIPLIKLVFSLLSVSLIVSAYRIGRNLVSETVGPAVDEAVRTLRAGELLLLELIEKALRLEAELVTLEVRDSNQVAQNLYTKYGFEYVGRRKRYYRDNNEDAHIMTVEQVQLPEYRAFLDNRWRQLEERLAPRAEPGLSASDHSA